MEDQIQASNSPIHGSERNEPVRSRWSPKPEQILILESIFNSGMVNPPKDETVKIRKLLEKFGTVGDANVFYWFQNRRSRSRRRQRQIQANLSAEQSAPTRTSGVSTQYESASHPGFVASPSFVTSPSSCLVGGASSSCGVVGIDGVVDNLFLFSGQMGLQEIEQNSAATSTFCPSDGLNLHYQSELISVYINGVVTEVPRGPLDMKAMFGQDLVCVHSSGLPVPVNECGFSEHSLQHGESYFL
ncbi:unnamed protein product, partial [Ilex paraguariensis]